MPVHVAELRQHRHDDGREQQLRRLEPVEVGIPDPEVVDQVGDERNVEALQDSAHEFNEEEVADEAERYCAGLPTHE